MFNARRLSIARKRRRFSQKSLAERSGLSPITISRLGTAGFEPEARTVELLAEALGYPVSFFFEDDLEEPSPDTVSFRSLSGMSAKERDAALSAGAIAFALDDWVRERFNLPSVQLVDLSFEVEPANAARVLRQHWGLGEKPIPHMIKLLESKGVRVFSLSENTKKVDAFSCWRDGTPYVFLNTFKSAEHSRFDAAHELGHLVLHKHAGPRHNRDAERQANEFASSFLMPRVDVEPRFPYVASLQEIVRGKRRWGVSVAALAYRLHRLGRISDWNYRNFCIQMSRNGYRSNEPDGLPMEESSVWRKVLASLWSDRITKSHIADQLHVPAEEIESLLFGLLGPARVGDLSGQSDRPTLRKV